MNTFYQKNYQCWPPVANRDMLNSDSYHWEQQARLVQRRLADLLGQDDYHLWAEITWPGDSIDSQSWKQIHDTCQAAIDFGEDAIYQQLECTCRPDATIATCPVCQANARIREREA